MDSHEIGITARIQIEEYVLHLLRSTPPISYRKETLIRSALRHLLTDAVAGADGDLLGLSLRPEICAAAFREPRSGDRSAVSGRLQTFRAFLIMELGGDEAARRLTAIEEHLIPRRTRHWHESERTGGGRYPRARRPIRLVFFDDLLKASVKAKEGKSPQHAQRDASLVSLLCFSALRWQEVMATTWEDLLWQDSDGGVEPFGAWCRCRRRDIELLLPVHRHAAAELALLHAITKRVMDRQPSGPVFRGLRHPYALLQYRDAKQIADDALALAGLNSATRRDLLAGFAFHLKVTHGFTHPDLRESLGYSEVQKVRNLLQSHEAWALNRTIDEMGGPVPGLKGVDSL